MRCRCQTWMYTRVRFDVRHDVRRLVAPFPAPDVGRAGLLGRCLPVSNQLAAIQYWA